MVQRCSGGAGVQGAEEVQRWCRCRGDAEVQMWHRGGARRCSGAGAGAGAGAEVVVQRCGGAEVVVRRWCRGGGADVVQVQRCRCRGAEVQRRHRGGAEVVQVQRCREVCRRGAGAEEVQRWCRDLGDCTGCDCAGGAAEVLQERCKRGAEEKCALVQLQVQVKW